VRRQITSGIIGTVYRTFADLSMISSPESLPDSHRLVSPKLAGGVLLDTGIYALTWVFQTLYTTQQNPVVPTVLSTLRKYRLGTDEQISVLLTFPREGEGEAHGIATASWRTSTDPDGTGIAGPGVRIQGSKGEIQVSHPAFRPTKTKLILTDGTVEEKDWPQPGPGLGSGWYNGFQNEAGGCLNQEGEGHGMFWEADECAFAIREGQKESQYQTLAESLVVMQIMDQVRKQNGIRYPEEIETTDYPIDMLDHCVDTFNVAPDLSPW
jgi:dihydrodiol dehydrogenase / D-xylose 1-dehydrogenase (NADP)